jgi:hypothetical protein
VNIGPDGLQKPNRKSERQSELRLVYRVRHGGDVQLDTKSRRDPSEGALAVARPAQLVRIQQRGLKGVHVKRRNAGGVA